MQPFEPSNDDMAGQQRVVLSALRQGPQSTIELRALHLMSPAARVMDLRRQGLDYRHAAERAVRRLRVASGGRMKPCCVTVFATTKPATLGKTYKLGLNGIEKMTAGQMVEGAYEVRSFGNVHGLAALLASIRTDQALCASLPIDGSTSGRIVTKTAMKDNPGALSRTKDCCALPVGAPALVILDYDPHGTPLTRDELWALLNAACPAIADCGVVWWCSGSSHLYDGDAEWQGLRGQRFYLVAADGTEAARFGDVLAKRLWLSGHGHVAVSASGSLLVRGIFDAAMFQPARFDFIEGSVCHPLLLQRRGQPFFLSEGGWLDTRAALPDLTPDEESRYLAAIDDAKGKAEPEAKALRMPHSVTDGHGETLCQELG